MSVSTDVSRTARLRRHLLELNPAPSRRVVEDGAVGRARGDRADGRGDAVLGFTTITCKPAAAGVYWGYLLAASTAIGALLVAAPARQPLRPPARAFGLLVGRHVAGAKPLAFDIGVLAEAPFFVLTFYLFLAFPMGRVEPRAARWMMAVLVFGVLAFFLPWALFTPVIAGGGPLTRCVPACPENVLQIGTAPDVVEVAGKAETYTALDVALGRAGRLPAACAPLVQPQRRALLAVAVTSLLFLPAYFVNNFAAWILDLDRRGARQARVGHRRDPGPPAARLPDRAAAGRPVRQHGAAQDARTARDAADAPTLARHGSPTRSTIDALQLGYHDPPPGASASPTGPSSPRRPAGPGLGPGRSRGPAVAAMVVDESLTEDPELVQAAAAATLLAVENGALEGELARPRAILQAGHEVRRQIQRDIHDSAQQRLLALRIQLSSRASSSAALRTARCSSASTQEVEQAIEELREVAHGGTPRSCAGRGRRRLGAAAARAPIA